MRRVLSWSQNSRQKYFSGLFYSEFLWCGMSPYAATPLIVFSSGHIDITTFRPWSAIATGNHLKVTEKISSVAQTVRTVKVFDTRSRITGTLRGVFPHVQSFINDDTIHFMWQPSSAAIDWAKIRLSTKIGSWSFSIIFGVVTFTGCPGRGASRVWKSPRSNWTT